MRALLATGPAKNLSWEVGLNPASSTTLLGTTRIKYGQRIMTSRHMHPLLRRPHPLRAPLLLPLLEILPQLLHSHQQWTPPWMPSPHSRMPFKLSMSDHPRRLLLSPPSVCVTTIAVHMMSICALPALMASFAVLANNCLPQPLLDTLPALPASMLPFCVATLPVAVNVSRSGHHKIPLALFVSQPGASSAAPAPTLAQNPIFGHPLLVLAQTKSMI